MWWICFGGIKSVEIFIKIHANYEMILNDYAKSEDISWVVTNSIYRSLDLTNIE